MKWFYKAFCSKFYFVKAVDCADWHTQTSGQLQSYPSHQGIKRPEEYQIVAPPSVEAITYFIYKAAVDIVLVLIIEDKKLRASVYKILNGPHFVKELYKNVYFWYCLWENFFVTIFIEIQSIAMERFWVRAESSTSLRFPSVKYVRSPVAFSVYNRRYTPLLLMFYKNIVLLFWDRLLIKIMLWVAVAISPSFHITFVHGRSLAQCHAYCGSG